MCLCVYVCTFTRVHAPCHHYSAAKQGPSLPFLEPSLCHSQPFPLDRQGFVSRFTNRQFFKGLGSQLSSATF